MKIGTRGLRRSCVIAAAVIGVLASVSCAPASTSGGGTTPTTTPPAAPTLISPTAGAAGIFVDVAPPGGDCLNPKYAYTSLQATLTTYNKGIVVTSAYGYVGGATSPSTYASSDPFVRLRIPPYVATGKYLVYLSCYNYLDSYQYPPATFTVTSTSG